MCKLHYLMPYQPSSVIMLYLMLRVRLWCSSLFFFFSTLATTGTAVKLAHHLTAKLSDETYMWNRSLCALDAFLYCYGGNLIVKKVYTWSINFIFVCLHICNEIQPTKCSFSSDRCGIKWIIWKLDNCMPLSALAIVIHAWRGRRDVLVFVCQSQESFKSF